MSDVVGSRLEVPLARTKAELLMLLAQRKLAGRGSEGLDSESWDLVEIAAALKVSPRPATVERYVRDINREFRSAGLAKRKEVLNVAEFRKSTTSPGERVLLIIDEVELHTA
jgi:hypothetical protein